MKKLFLIIIAVLTIGTLAHAQGAPKAGEFGIQGALTFTSVGGPIFPNFPSPASGAVGAKYWINNDIAVRAALGFLNTAATGGSTTLYDLGAGFEYHFGGKGGVSPYAGAEISYSAESISAGGGTPSDFAVKGVFGGEYFFSSNFSWAGELGLGFDSFKNAAGNTTTTIGTLGFATFLTWYIN